MHHRALRLAATLFLAACSSAAQAGPLPAPQFSSHADIMILMDESGSVSSTEWAQEKDFVAGFINSRAIGPTTDKIGIGKYSSAVELVSPLTFSRPSLIVANAAALQIAGGTCVPCGFTLAAGEFAANGRADAPDVVLLLMDGVNNSGDLAASVAAMQAQATIFVIGIGFTDPQVDAIASDIDGVQTSFLLTEFGTLPTLLNALTQSFAALVPVPAPPLSGVLALALGAVFLRRRGRGGRRAG